MSMKPYWWVIERRPEYADHVHYPLLHVGNVFCKEEPPSEGPEGWNLDFFQFVPLVKFDDHIAEVVELRQELLCTTATADRLRDELNEVWKVLPADCAYMDPPDGGDVPLIEQLRRMAEDAWKYRQLNA